MDAGTALAIVGFHSGARYLASHAAGHLLHLTVAGSRLVELLLQRSSWRRFHFLIQLDIHEVLIATLGFEQLLAFPFRFVIVAIIDFFRDIHESFYGGEAFAGLLASERLLGMVEGG